MSMWKHCVEKGRGVVQQGKIESSYLSPMLISARTYINLLLVSSRTLLINSYFIPEFNKLNVGCFIPNQISIKSYLIWNIYSNLLAIRKRPVAICIALVIFSDAQNAYVLSPIRSRTSCVGTMDVLMRKSVNDVRETAVSLLTH